MVSPEPEPQESVWDYPRPPAIFESAEHLEIWLGGEVIAGTDRSWRVLETSHPPTYYLPIDCFAGGVLIPVSGTTVCEWSERSWRPARHGISRPRPRPTPHFAITSP